MASVKAVNRSATIALAPEAPYIAAGTMAGAVDLSFSSSATLEIFELDFQSDDKELPMVGDSQCSERFNRLSWAKNGSGSENFALGLVAGGLVDGSIDIWNPLSLIRPKSGENAIVGHLSRHKGPVRGLEFNEIAPNLLASGADDGEICIWDLANPEQPSHFPPLKGSGSADQGEISFLSWNSKVQHILASTSRNGITVVWDLKRQKPVISFSDPSRRRCSVLQWNPDIATQLVVASDDDSSPSLRLWDMRNTMAPVKEFVGHTRGVIAMSWCPIDSSFLLTCSKDNRTICWDTISGEIVRELPVGNNWNFDVHWYPRIPGIISASSFDGKIGIYNIEGCCRNGNGESDFSGASLKAPKWYKRPAGVSFGFGGKLVSFHPTSSAAGSSVSASEVHVHNLVTEQSLVGRSSEFESTIQNGDRSFLRLLCEKKSEESEVEDDRETWGFLKVMFEDDGTTRTKLLTHLGFSMPADNKDVVQDDLSKEINGLLPDEPVVDKMGYEGDNEATTFPLDNGEDFFNNLPSPKADTPVAISGDKFARGDSVPGEEQQEMGHTEEETADSSFDDDVQRALVVGDYKGAIAMCMSANKMADALVIAHVGGASLWEDTRDQYLKMSGLPYLKIVYAMVNNDLLSLVNTRPLKFWKETLALLCSFAQREEWSTLCDTLASRLMSAGNTLAATLCYICSGNIDKTVEIWSRSLSAKPEGKSYVDLLQDLMEKTIVLALASGQKRFNASLWKLVEKYAEILASQGLLTTALEYLRLLGSDELSPALVVLRDRISLAIESENEVKSVDFGNYQLINGDAAAADAEVSTHYYKEQVAPLHQQHSSRIPYGENYPLQSHGVGGYSVPSPYQPAPQPHIFLPSQAPQAPKENFTAPGALAEPALRPFSPATLPPLRNVEKYQQPTTLASQLYPENAVSSKMMDSVPDYKIPDVVAPTPPLTGFMPVPNPGVGPRPIIRAIQPPSPTPPPTIQPALTSAPPPTIQTAVTSNVPVNQKPVVVTLTKLFIETSEALGGAQANPGKKREIEDNSRKIGALFAKLNSLDISKNAADKLVQLCQALDKGDYSTALQIQVLLTTSEWEECSFWLAPLKRMIKTRQSLR